MYTCRRRRSPRRGYCSRGPPRRERRLQLGRPWQWGPVPLTSPPSLRLPSTTASSVRLLTCCCCCCCCFFRCGGRLAAGRSPRDAERRRPLASAHAERGGRLAQRDAAAAAARVCLRPIAPLEANKRGRLVLRWTAGCASDHIHFSSLSVCLPAHIYNTHARARERSRM